MTIQQTAAAGPAAELVLVERTGPREAAVTVHGQRFAARFDATLRAWRVETPDGERVSVSAKLHSIGKLFNTPRAQVAGAPPVELAPAIVFTDPAAARQARRMLDSMREFGFDQYWESHHERHGGETGHSHRVAGDPIFHTIGQVAGVDATRAETIEAIVATLEGSSPILAARLQRLAAGVKAVAEALAAGKRRAAALEGGAVVIEGPILPPDWDATIATHDDADHAEWPADWDEV